MLYKAKPLTGRLGAVIGLTVMLTATVSCYFFLVWCCDIKDIPFAFLFPIVIGWMICSLILVSGLHKIFPFRDNVLYEYLLLLYGLLWFLIAYAGLESFGVIMGEPMPLPLFFLQGLHPNATTLTFVYSWFWFGYVLIYSPAYRNIFKWIGLVLFFPAFLVYNTCKDDQDKHHKRITKYFQSNSKK